MQLMACTGRGTSGSVTSSARLLPEPGSGDKKAIRGVESHASINQQCAIQRVCAISSWSLG
ncbi:Uncharacterised protein [Mycobacterium tuberculosis]|uniref:Uncharacterized protein n=1 Tax=Mycobacterium tuberculosis TaxID=1773 RepID=A0A0U0RSJ4_MYCTX|nr:Uncharacterised protein [Mycobacterium tuberculosis]